MEFYAEIRNQSITVDELSSLLSIDHLPVHCASIDTILSRRNDTEAEIYCVWGQFTVTHQRIRNGVRFSLLTCPHALTWTITRHDDLNAIIIHCTIDKKHEDTDFVESIQQFVDEWARGLKTALAGIE